ncbi:uncharacterized protein LOC143182951 [Calliopsis andreniformis]|uniref:uncharacterized protein LOC143182951 n=1 Tax=Calliopsis andreniformis TaxID=337506 RepID=UPI003FCD552D
MNETKLNPQCLPVPRVTLTALKAGRTNSQCSWRKSSGERADGPRWIAKRLNRGKEIRRSLAGGDDDVVGRWRDRFLVASKVESRFGVLVIEDNSGDTGYGYWALRSAEEGRTERRNAVSLFSVPRRRCTPLPPMDVPASLASSTKRSRRLPLIIQRINSIGIRNPSPANALHSILSFAKASAPPSRWEKGSLVGLLRQQGSVGPRGRSKDVSTNLRRSGKEMAKGMKGPRGIKNSWRIGSRFNCKRADAMYHSVDGVVREAIGRRRLLMPRNMDNGWLPVPLGFRGRLLPRLVEV